MVQIAVDTYLFYNGKKIGSFARSHNYDKDRHGYFDTDRICKLKLLLAQEMGWDEADIYVDTFIDACASWGANRAIEFLCDDPDLEVRNE